VSNIIQSKTSHRPRILTHILVLCDRLNCYGQLMDNVWCCLLTRVILACGMILSFRQIGTVHLHTPMEKVFGSIPDTYTNQAVSQSQIIVLLLGLRKLRTGSRGQRCCEGRWSASYWLCSQSLLCLTERIPAAGYHIWLSGQNKSTAHTLY
jgi:hypothetical protein